MDMGPDVSQVLQVAMLHSPPREVLNASIASSGWKLQDLSRAREMMLHRLDDHLEDLDAINQLSSSLIEERNSLILSNSPVYLPASPLRNPLAVSFQEELQSQYGPIHRRVSVLNLSDVPLSRAAVELADLREVVLNERTGAPSEVVTCPWRRWIRRAGHSIGRTGHRIGGRVGVVGNRLGHRIGRAAGEASRLMSHLPELRATRQVRPMPLDLKQLAAIEETRLRNRAIERRRRERELDTRIWGDSDMPSRSKTFKRLNVAGYPLERVERAMREYREDLGRSREIAEAQALLRTVNSPGKLDRDLALEIQRAMFAANNRRIF